ncbi:MAG: metallopeptidase TldD-related protein [Persicimonas sp.]
MKKLFGRGPLTRLWLLAFAALMGCAASPERGGDIETGQQADQREVVMDALQSELDRSMEGLELDDYRSPYFLAYRVDDIEARSLSGRYGAIVEDDEERQRVAYVETRVGDYEFDNFANISSENFRFSDYSVEQTLPIEADAESLQSALWLLTDQSYKEALSDFQSKKGGAVFETEDKLDVPSFSKEEPVEYEGEVVGVDFDEDRWRATIKDVTRSMLDSEPVVDSSMDVGARRTVNYFVNSEGTRVVDENLLYSVQIQAYARAEDGMMLENARSFYAHTVDELPDDETIKEEADKLVDELEALYDSEPMDPYTGPAIVLPEASGVLFHEAVGHRLEGERQLDDEEGRTFEGQRGERIIPEFLSVYDDPTKETWEGMQLNGHYRYDQEGVKAERVELVEDGVLRNFLKSRTPIEDSPNSNGHGRAHSAQKPMAHMGNLIVEASDETKTYPYEELKEKLIEEVKEQDKPYGLIIRDISGGSTNTLGYGYQAFKGDARLVFKVDPETGEETLVRGVEMVGTPLTSINKIVAASEETGVFNGYCGAESGNVPVSAIAPALLTTEVELQRSQKSKERPPIMDAPWKRDDE